MLNQKVFNLFVVLAILLAFITPTAVAQKIEGSGLREKAQAAMKNRNYKDAFGVFEQIVHSGKADERKVVSDFNNAINCLNRLGRVKEFNVFVEKAITANKDNWRMLEAAAYAYQQTNHYGFMISGKFERGPHRGGGEQYNAMERDRVRSLQLLRDAMKSLDSSDDRVGATAGSFYLRFAGQIRSNRNYSASWQLQSLTDLDELPDHAKGYPYYRGNQGASVDSTGEPIYYDLVKDWDSAFSDGERWRWLLKKAVDANPRIKNQVRSTIAQFAPSTIWRDHDEQRDV